MFISKKNIIICSKQFLQTKIDKGHDKQKHSNEKTKSIAWLKKMSFDMRFIDESHNGGTTELAQKTLDFYGKHAFTVQITATYSKPINDYNIPKDCWILWDLEDIKLCKNIRDECSIIRLVEKHGDCIQNIISEILIQKDFNFNCWDRKKITKDFENNNNIEMIWRIIKYYLLQKGFKDRHSNIENINIQFEKVPTLNSIN